SSRSTSRARGTTSSPPSETTSCTRTQTTPRAAAIWTSPCTTRPRAIASPCTPAGRTTAAAAQTSPAWAAGTTSRSRNAGGPRRYLLKDDAEAKDALQDVFVKVLGALPEFRAAASPTTWILRIATHHCLNLLRARRALWRDQLRMAQAGRRQETESPDRRELV